MNENRYWINISILDINEMLDEDDKDYVSEKERQEKIKDGIIELGFDHGENHNWAFKTMDLEEAKEIAKKAVKIIADYTDFEEKEIRDDYNVRIEIQPKCKECGALLRWSWEYCADCGGESTGKYNYVEDW